MPGGAITARRLPTSSCWSCVQPCRSQHSHQCSASGGRCATGGIRRLILPRTRYHVYYRVAGQVLEILAVWHAVRGSGPGL